MEEIVKIGQATDTIREFNDNNPTSTLLHDYQMPMHENTARTARTPSMYADVLQKEAENLLALQNAPTPLKGGINTPLHDLNLQSALPQDRSIATPNTVLSNIAATPSSVLQGTPGQSEPPTPSGTPFRDQLSINNPQLSYDSRGELKKALSSLPAPRNEFVIMVPPEETEISQEETTDWVEDASDVDAENAEARELLRIQKLKKNRMSYNVDCRNHQKLTNRTMQFDGKYFEKFYTAIPCLPLRYDWGSANLRTLFVVMTAQNVSDKYFMADDVIKSEMFSILKHDVDQHPIDDISLEDLEEAEKMIQNELRPEEHADLNANLWGVIEQCSSELILAQNKFTRLGVLPKKIKLMLFQLNFR
ncbi:Cell division cycle 5-like protein [Dirofilaria immitis]|nr:Cell division cycle 5-like protein [Dirofilaria immitis]